MKILRAGEILREQRRAAHRAGFVHEQAAVGLVRKQQLRRAINDERIQAAQDDGEEHCRHNRAAEFSKMVFIIHMN